MSRRTRRERKQARLASLSRPNNPQPATEAPAEVRREQAVARREFRAEFARFQGPLPPPAALAEYERIQPGAADRIIGMAERQSSHRQELERSVVLGNVRKERFGQISASVLGMTAILGGIGLIAFDKSTEGLVSIITAFTALAGVFIYGRYEQNQERKRKQEELARAAQEPLLPFDQRENQ